MRILNRGPEHYFLYHLIRSLYWVNISMTRVYSGIQWDIYVKPFYIPSPPPPPALCLKPFPLFTGLIWALGERSKTLKPYFSKWSSRWIINREVKHDVTYSKWQTAKMRLLPSLFSYVYSGVKLFVFAMITRRRYSIFVCFIYGLEEKNSKSTLTSWLTSLTNISRTISPLGFNQMLSNFNIGKGHN